MMLLQRKDEKRETTATILDKLRNAPFENVVLHAGGQRLLVDVQLLKMAAMASVPDFIKDPESEAAKKYSTFRTAIKAMVRPFLPELLKATWGKDVAIEPRLNILSWLPEFFIHFLIGAIASKEWELHVEPCESCGENVFKVVGFSPRAQPIVRSSAASSEYSADANRESVSGGEDGDTLRPENRNQSG